MAQLKGKDLIVANTTNVKEMKNGRPMNVEIPEANMPNCSIVKLGAVKTDKPENDHVYTVTKLTSKADVQEAIAAGEAYVIVAPEIMVEEARHTDGHIGLFRFEQGAVQTAYQLHFHDRLELAAEHPQVAYADEVSRRNMAEAMYLLAAADRQAAIVMVKVEFLPAAAAVEEEE